MVKSKLDGTSDYTKLKKENEELKSKKIANKESVIAYINELEKKANDNQSYKYKLENNNLKKRFKNANRFIDNAILPLYKKDIEILKKILNGDD